MTALPSQAPSTVYYSNFWYSRFYRPLPYDFGGNQARDELTQHKFRLRLLSLFFDKIYIPRSHLLTFRHEIQGGIDRSVFEDRDFGFLFENGQILVSSLPGIDAKQDNERILARSSSTDRVIYPDDPSYIEMVPISDLYEIDSMLEAASNTISFPDYGRRISITNPSVSERFLEILKRSEIDGLPFFHENFISLVREEFDDEIFYKIWRETNSIYLTTGGVGQSGIIPFFNEEIESVNFRYEPHNLDRYLYSPASLYQFLSLFLSGTEMSRFIQNDIESVVGFIHKNQDYNALWRDFKSDFHRLVSNISHNTIPMQIGHVLEQPVINELFDMALNDRFRRGSKLLTSLIDDAEKISRAADVDGAGLVGVSLRAAARYGQGLMQAFSLRRRYPAISQLTNILKGHLRKDN
ncbi:hypothetical protein [uncultured Tateyamaria sp.]|uniref:hypothetical protein n=1 Tax=uncultured Tateyamaria sp. TaxID=455651 RepID=UPI002622859D|nr:hypothetical protein [uncultured Tateyamaria sp.]